MPEMTVTVRDKYAQVQGNPEIVCGNSDYTVTFDFDAEWDGEPTAHIRYLRDGIPVETDILIVNDTCDLPAVYGTDELCIGAYTDTVQTSTPAVIPCIMCVTDFAGEPQTVRHDVYNDLMQMLNQMLSPFKPGIHQTLATYTNAELARFTHAELAALGVNI